MTWEFALFIANGQARRERRRTAEFAMAVALGYAAARGEKKAAQAIDRGLRGEDAEPPDMARSLAEQTGLPVDAVMRSLANGASPEQILQAGEVRRRRCRM